MGWRSLIDSGWRPPYLACIQCAGEFAGSGLLVGPRHVLTALHVVGAPLDEAAAMRRIATVGEPLREPPPDEVFEISFASSPSTKLTGRCLDFDRHDDIALLELDVPAHGVARPRFVDGPPRERQAVVALGFIGQGVGRTPIFRSQTGDASLSTAVREGGRDLHYHVNFGAQAGFSGGPVFLADDGPCPRLIGMSRLGGDAAGHGQVVAAGLLFGWLRDRLPDLAGDAEGPNGRSEALTRGFEPYHRVAPGPDFLFAALDGADRIAARQTFVALAPLSRATALDGSAATTAFDVERPAHFGSAAEVAQTFERLGRAHGLRFRSPSGDEIAQLAARAGRARPNALLGEPATLRRFVADDGGPRLPPDGVLEWCATQSGRVVREHRGGTLRETHEPTLRQTRLVARLAFDVETGA